MEAETTFVVALSCEVIIDTSRNNFIRGKNARIQWTSSCVNAMARSSSPQMFDRTCLYFFGSVTLRFLNISSCKNLLDQKERDDCNYNRNKTVE